MYDLKNTLVGYGKFTMEAHLLISSVKNFVFRRFCEKQESTFVIHSNHPWAILLFNILCNFVTVSLPFTFRKYVSGRFVDAAIFNLLNYCSSFGERMNETFRKSQKI